MTVSGGVLWSVGVDEDEWGDEQGEDGVDVSGEASVEEAGLGERERCCALGEVEVEVLPAG